MLVLLVFGAVAVFGFLLEFVVVWLMARWLRAEKATAFRVFLAVLLVGAAGLAGAGLPNNSLKGELGIAPSWALVASMLGLAVALALATLIYKTFLSTTVLRAMAIYAGQFCVRMALLGFAVFIFRPYIAEAFVVPTNTMAPTLVGWHKEAACPRCGEMLIIPAYPDRPAETGEKTEKEIGICCGCLKSAEVPFVTGAICPRDRFLIDKRQIPKRWNVVVFRYPVDPTTYYVKRVVGMPGERVEIREGGIWINGKRAALPRELAGLEYTDGSQGGYRPPEFVTSWQLTDNEYIVLGDFSAKSSDSRLWGPVPTENMVGVVQCIYWPPARCRWFE